MMKKSLVIVCGLPGSGKSYFARALAERIGAKHLNSDEIRQHLFEDRSYSTREKIAVYRQMADLAFEYLEKDKRVVVDATFSKLEFRELFRKRADDAGILIEWIEIIADIEVIRERVGKKRRHSEADFEVYQKIAREFVPLKDPHITVRSTNDNLASMLNTAVFNLRTGMTNDEIKSLAEKGTYKGRPVKGELIETHISWVILAKEFAFKIKKPMHYPFLDFSTLAKRKHNCKKEIVLNRRLSDIYLDVLPIRRTKQNTFFIGEGQGELIEYAVRMNKMDNNRRMDVLLQRNEVGEGQIQRLAQRIYAFHRSAEIIPGPLNLRQLQEDFNDILTVVDWVEELQGGDFQEMVRTAVNFSDQFLSSHKKLLQGRIDEGFRRDLHGDLHSRNIFLYPDPVIFDCIEFNDELRHLDIINELAFFCMDLDAFDHSALGGHLIAEYNSLFPCLRNAEEWDLFRYYKCYRANVRAKVNVLRARQTDDEDFEKECKNEIVKYINLMTHYIGEVKS